MAATTRVAGIGAGTPPSTIPRGGFLKRILPNFISISEFNMIHHFARALAARHNASALAAAGVGLGVASGSAPGSAQRPASQQPVRPRPITPWGGQPRCVPAGRGAAQRPVRISVDPQDARRTVITGRFAEVCAALDRLVLEQEALA